MMNWDSNTSIIIQGFNMNVIAKAAKANIIYVSQTLTHPKPIEQCILTPFGMSLFLQLNGELKPLLSQEIYDILPILGDVLSLHSNTYASYTPATALVHEQRFYEWVFYFERKMDYVWDESQIPKEYCPKDFVFDAFRKLAEAAKRNKYIAANHQKLNSMIAHVLLLGFRDEIDDIFIPDLDRWNDQHGLNILSESPYIFRKKVDDGYLFINAHGRLQLLSDQPELTPLMWVQLHTRDTTYILQYECLGERRQKYQYVYRAWLGSFDPFVEVKK